MYNTDLTPGISSIGTLITRDNLFLGNLLVATNDSNALGGTVGWTYYFSDHLGTPRLISGVEGPVTEKYWPYGEEYSANNTSQKLRFATMERDTESSHFYDHARSHDFNLGRFVSVDKHAGHPESPQTWNRYAYAGGNPVAYLDPDGKERGYSADFYKRSISQAGLSAAGRTISQAWNKAAPYIAFALMAAEFIASEGASPNPELSTEAGAEVQSTEVAIQSAEAGAAKVAGDSEAATFFEGTKYAERVEVQMSRGDFHGFPKLVEGNYAGEGTVSQIVSKEGNPGTMLTIKGSYQGKAGTFEFIKDANGTIYHRFFNPDPE